MMNKHSYRYELIKNKKGMFDNYIDMVYILTLEDSTRKEHYMNQINKYLPHKNILIQYNKGYKKCNKKLYKQEPASDLNDAYYQVFTHALKKKYENIIIFEDDFFFDHNINQYIVDDIGNFIKNNKYDIYHLGNVFGIPIPSYSTHIRYLNFSCSHSVIYNNLFFKKFIEIYNNGFSEPNDMIWNNLNIIKYSYYKPLCFQILLKTENRDAWITGKISVPLYEFFNLHKTHEPGYTVLNILSFIVSFIIIFIFIKLIIFMHQQLA